MKTISKPKPSHVKKKAGKKKKTKKISSGNKSLDDAIKSLFKNK